MGPTVSASFRKEARAEAVDRSRLVADSLQADSSSRQLSEGWALENPPRRAARWEEVL